MDIISNNTEKTLNNRGWENVNRRGFSVVIYRDDFNVADWQDICENAEADISNDYLQVLCIASTSERTHYS
jgi:hypothetical protein